MRKSLVSCTSTRLAALATLVVASLLLPPSALAAERGEDPDGAAGANSTLFFTRTVRVDCDQGQTISRAVDKFGTELVIEFKGTCTEDVVIERDRTSLQGSAPGATIVGSVSIRGATNVALTGFLVRDSAGNAIDIIQGSAATLDDIRVENAGDRGVRVAQSTANLNDVTVAGAGTVGILGRSGKLVLTGTIATSDAVLGGLSLADNSSAFSNDGDLSATGSQFGLVVEENSAFSKPFGTISLTGNSVGALVAAQGHVSYGADFDASDNNFFGLWLNENSSFSVFEGFTPAPVTTVLDNGLFGILVESGSSLTLVADTTIARSVFGIEAEAGIIEVGGTTFDGNFAADLDLGFGTLATLRDGNTVDEIFCELDEFVVLRGTASCTVTEGAQAVAPDRLDQVKRQLRKALSALRTLG